MDFITSLLGSLKCSFSFNSLVINVAINFDNSFVANPLVVRPFVINPLFDNYYFVGSLNSNDISLCEKIIQTDLKEACNNENK